MWWQALAPGAVVFVAPFVGFCLLPVAQYAFTGRTTQRGLVEANYLDRWCKSYYRRDWDLNGNEYDSKGLDYLPDD